MRTPPRVHFVEHEKGWTLCGLTVPYDPVDRILPRTVDRSRCTTDEALVDCGTCRTMIERPYR